MTPVVGLVSGSAASSPPIPSTPDPLLSTKEKVLVAASAILLGVSVTFAALAFTGTLAFACPPLLLAVPILIGTLSSSILVYKVHQVYKENKLRKEILTETAKINETLKDNKLPLNKIVALEKRLPEIASATYSIIAKQNITTVLGNLKNLKVNKEKKMTPGVKILQRRWRTRTNNKLIFTAIRNGRQLDDLDKEFTRLKKSKVGPMALKEVGESDKQLFVIVARALQRKEVYKDTHYVFTHGQSLTNSIANTLIKELFRKFTPEKYFPNMPTFRIPEMVPESENVNAFFKKHDPDYLTDNDINAELLSVDGYFGNIDGGESARNYFIRNINVNHRSVDHISLLFSRIIRHYVVDFSMSHAIAFNELLKKISTIATNKHQESRVGALYMICIPKERISNPKENYVYRCHDYGRLCRCKSEDEFIKTLNAHQSDQRTVQCAQYRIITSAFSKDRTARVFQFTALTKEKRKEYRTQIRNIVLELHVYTQLLKLKEPPKPQELEALKSDIGKLLALSNFDKATLKTILDQQKQFVQITC